MLNFFTLKKLSVKLFVVLFLFSFNIYAQESSSVILKLSENALGNLKNGIVSENPGLRKSSIELASKYSIDGVAETLLSQLKKEKDPELKILIIRSLYIIGDDKFLSEIYDIVSNDKDAEVRKMGSAIYTVMNVKKKLTIAKISD